MRFILAPFLFILSVCIRDKNTDSANQSRAPDAELQHASNVAKTTSNNIVRIFGQCKYPTIDNKLIDILLMEFCPSDLRARLEDHRKVSGLLVVQFIKGICDGLRHLHTVLNIYHGDLRGYRLCFSDFQIFRGGENPEIEKKTLRISMKFGTKPAYGRFQGVVVKKAFFDL